MTLLRRLLALLDGEGVKAALIGAAAMAAYGVNRATLDQDLLAVAMPVVSQTTSGKPYAKMRSRSRSAREMPRIL